MARSKKQKGLGGKDAERLFERWLRYQGHEKGKTYHRAGAVRMGGFTAREDIFALDMIVFDGDTTIGYQITTNNGRKVRREKIEAIPFPAGWRLCVVTHEQTEDPADRRRKLDFWKVETLWKNGEWHTATRQFNRTEVEKVKLGKPRKKKEETV